MISVMPDTTLCMIVRDEMENPAGGIKRFLDTNLPRFSDAVIVDTGSVDGTREALEDYTARYPQLRVYDRTFDGYHHSRNMSLRKARTRRALVLDVDEHIRAADWEALVQRVNANPTQDRWHFAFRDICSDKEYDLDEIPFWDPRNLQRYHTAEMRERFRERQQILDGLQRHVDETFDGGSEEDFERRVDEELARAPARAAEMDYRTYGHSHNPRLFDIGDRRYGKAVWERLYEKKPVRARTGFSDWKTSISIVDTETHLVEKEIHQTPYFAQTIIHHFKPTASGIDAKRSALYGDKSLEERQSETRKDELNWLMWELAWMIPPTRICLRASRIPRTPSPSGLPNNHLWRAYNPLRDQLE